MCTIYNNIKSLCDERGVKPGRMCVELGMSKSILTGLKNGTKKNIQTDTAQKIADYFGVTVDRVLGAEKETAVPKDVGLSPMESQLMEYVRTLTDDQKKMLLAQLQALKNQE
jgi:transcriptional regulator with XRE-family HTH domain